MKLLQFTLFLLFLFTMFISLSSAQELKVGVYNNPPLVFKENDEIKGFYIDILEAIAKEEGWKISYVYGNFSDLLEKLKNGEVDLLVDIAYTEERASIFKFNNETVLTNWGVVVSKEQLDSILDLEGLKVAGAKGDVYYENLKKLVDKFDIECEFVEVKGDYPEVFEAVKSGKAAAGVVSRLYAHLNADKYGLKETNIIFSPVKLKFAGNNETILKAIDDELRAMKKDENSVFYQALYKWFEPRVVAVPQWVYTIAAALLIILFTAITFNIYLSRVVYKKTKELRETNEKLRMREKQIKLLNSILRHDILNALTPIMFALEDKEDEISRIAMKKIEYITKLIETTRKLEKGFDALEPIRLDSLAKEVSEKFSVEFEGEEVRVMANDALRSVIFNLVQNAVKHSGGKVKIEVTKDNGWGVLRVKDTGRGIPDELKEKIFEKNFTTENGSGMGLFIVKNLVDIYGGKISVYDNKPKGVVFEVRLKAA